MEHPVIVVYDANVLYPATLRDLLIRIGHAGLVRSRWTDEIHDEWIRNVLGNNPGLEPERLNRTRALMNDAIRDCLITGYEGIIESLTLPDPNDRHVLAAAIHAKAQVIVTYNIRDFPKESLGRFAIESLHPDEFLADLFAASPDDFLPVVRRLRNSLRNPLIHSKELLESFEKQRLTQLVKHLRPFVDSL